MCATAFNVEDKNKVPIVLPSSAPDARSIHGQEIVVFFALAVWGAFLVGSRQHGVANGLCSNYRTLGARSSVGSCLVCVFWGVCAVVNMVWRTLLG